LQASLNELLLFRFSRNFKKWSNNFPSLEKKTLPVLFMWQLQVSSPQIVWLSATIQQNPVANLLWCYVDAYTSKKKEQKFFD
jgi:hypothetical protein